MRLEPLCEMEFSYRAAPTYDGPFKYVVPYGTQEASLYGEGDATFRGERLSGTGRFVNLARRRSDAVCVLEGELRSGGTTFARIYICEAELDS